MKIYLITRAPSGKLMYAINLANTPQAAVDKYHEQRGSNTPVAWTTASPRGHLAQALEDCIERGQTITDGKLVDNRTPSPNVQKACGITVSSNGDVTCKPAVSPKDQAMLLRDMRVNAPKYWTKERLDKDAVKKPVPTAKPCPFAAFTSPDLQPSTHQANPLHASAALL